MYKLERKNKYIWYYHIIITNPQTVIPAKPEKKFQEKKRIEKKN